MQLNKIVDQFENNNLEDNFYKLSFLSYEKVQPYLKSLSIYFEDYFCSNPLLLIEPIGNGASLCTIVSHDMFNDVISNLIASNDENNRNLADVLCLYSIEMQKC